MERFCSTTPCWQKRPPWAIEATGRMRVSSLLTHSFDNEDNDSDELYFNHMGFWNIEVQYKNDEFKQYKTYFYAFNTF